MAILISVIICCAVGAINGLLVAFTSIDPFIVTLGSQVAVRGLVYIVGNNTAVTGLPDSFKALSNKPILDVSMSIWIMILVFVFMAIVIGTTAYGRRC